MKCPKCGREMVPEGRMGPKGGFYQDEWLCVYCHHIVWLKKERLWRGPKTAMSRVKDAVSRGEL